MDARPLLERIAGALVDAKLEVILIGNAAAALQGAPVTTLDFDFFFRDTPANRRKLVAFARSLGAIVLRPYYPASSLFRVTNDDISLQADFLGTIHGIRSFEGAKNRASALPIGRGSLLVAALEDILKSKAAANSRRTAPLFLFSRLLSMRSASERNSRSATRRRAALSALRRESERELVELIERLLRKPMHERTHFLRRRLPGGGSSL